MSASSLLRVRAWALFVSMAVHAIALGACLLIARAHPVGFGMEPTAITLVTLTPETARLPITVPTQPIRRRTQLTPPPQPAPLTTAASSIPDAMSAGIPAVQSPSKAEEDAYARAVWMQLAAHRPRAVAGARTARIAFGLTIDGQVRYALIAQSSGSAAFDDRCLAAVRNAAPYPQAPAGASQDLLDFVAPITMR